MEDDERITLKIPASAELRAAPEKPDRLAGMKRPGYAAGLHHQVMCRNCRVGRYVHIEGNWEPCDGAGPNRQVRCGYCGHSFVEWRGCMHRDEDVDCLISKRRRGLLPSSEH